MNLVTFTEEILDGKLHAFIFNVNCKYIYDNLFPDGIYLFKVNDVNSSTMYEICSKLTFKTPDRRH